MCERFQYHPPWWVTRWGWRWPLWYRGTDEFHNPSITLIVPMVGLFVVFPGRLNRSGGEHVFGYGPEGLFGAVVEGCDLCDEIVAEYHAVYGL